MTAPGDLASTLAREPLPATLDRWRVTLEPGSSRATRAGDWAGCLVLVERGIVDLECHGDAHRSFGPGDILAPGWLRVRMLHNRGGDVVRLLAVRRATEKGDRPMKFRTVVELGGRTATGLRVPDEVVTALGAGKRPAVSVRIGEHVYRSTVAVMDGVFMLPLSAENREAAGVAAGDEVEVEVALDTAPRVISVPDDLAAALNAEPAARRTFDALSYSNQRFHVESVTGAKSGETRQRRIARAIATLREGRPR